MKRLHLFLRCIALLLTLALLAPFLVTAEDVGISSGANNQSISKLSADLVEELQIIEDNTKVRVDVFMADLDEEIALDLFAKRHPEEYAVYMAAKEYDGNENAIINGDLSLKDGIGFSSVTQSSKDTLQEAIELKRAIFKELYAKSNAAILNQFISEEDRVFVSQYAPFAIIKADKATIMELAEKSSVLSISKSNDLISSDESLQIANEITRARYVRDIYGNRGSGVKIGLLERGIPDITDPYLASANITIRSYEENEVRPHATKVARILVGTDNTGENDGYAPDAELYCSAKIYDSDIFIGVEWFIDQGVNVINYSGGVLMTGAYTALDQWVDHIAVQHDVHFVKSAGNDAGNITSPGMAYNVITVGGMTAGGSTNVSDFVLYEDTNYEETDLGRRAEKPNLVAPADVFDPDTGTSYAAPQVAGTIAQLCSYVPALKVKQSAMGAILTASAAKKVEAVGSGEKGDSFLSSVRVTPQSSQISDREGAGILDARWARGIVSYGNYWSYSINATSFPYSKTVTISATANSVTRVAIFWLKRNTVDHSSNTVTQLPLADLDLYVYDPNGNLIGCSILSNSNFEIVQFVPQTTGTYTISVSATSCNDKEHVGIAVW